MPENKIIPIIQDEELCSKLRELWKRNNGKHGSITDVVVMILRLGLEKHMENEIKETLRRC